MRRSFLIFISVVLFACDSEKEHPSSGKLEGRNYSNEFFDFEVTIPDNWVIQNEDEIKKLSSIAKEEITHADSALGEKINSTANVFHLLQVFQHKVDIANKVFNPSFIIMAEKLPSNVKEMNEAIYLNLTKNQLASTGLYQTFEQMRLPVKIDGEDFFLLRVSSQQKDVVTQEFYTKFVNDYALIFIVSYINEQQKQSLKNIIENVEMN